MPDFLKLEPGLVFWTLVNFSIFVFILAKFAWKPMKEGMAAREQAIGNQIKSAESANAEAQSILREAKERSQCLAAPAPVTARRPRPG